MRANDTARTGLGLLCAASTCAALTLTACGAQDVVVPDARLSAAPPAAAPASAAPGAAAVAFPDVPPVVVPDVTALTTASDRFTDALGGLVTPASGIAVSGARCDGAGRVINRGSLTAVNGGDGSGSVVDDGKTVTDNGDGSGGLVDGDRTITIGKDGSGSYVDGDRTITINADGSGSYVDGSTTVTVGADGSGSSVDGDRTITVGADGSGSFVDGGHTVTNNGDGSGSFVGGGHTVVNNGDGTGLADGAAVAMPRLDPVPPVGRFPGVGAIAPLGAACGTLIRLSDRVLFDFDKDVLRPEAGPVLDGLAGALAGVDGPLKVNGHTDAKGDDPYNLDLSRRRAQAVADGLRERGVAQELVPTGFGESQPIADNERDGRDNPEGRQLNRRVEIVFPGG